MKTVLIGIATLLVVSGIQDSEALFRADQIPGAINGLLPVCTFNLTSATCCATVGMVFKTKVCGVIKINLNELKFTSGMTINDNEVIQNNLEVGKVCYPPVPSPPAACLHMYWVDVSRQDKRVDACFQASVAGVATVDFPCIRWQNGEFSQNYDHKPPKKGMIGITVPAMRRQ